MHRPIFASLLVVAACGTDPVEPPGTDPPSTPRATWYQDVAPIVATHCMACHQPGGIAPFSLATFEDGALLAEQMTTAIDAGAMPPFSPDDAADCTPTHAWRDDPRLSEAERQTLAVWIEDGKAAGDFVDITPPSPPVLADKTHALTINPYVTQGDADELICFLLDPATTTDTWLTGWHVRPGNAAVVHHALISTLPASLMPAAKQQIGVGNSLPCSAGAGVPGSVLVGAWAPGGQPFDSGDVGTRLGTGDGLILQIHYHPGGQVADPDATTVDLRLQSTPTTAEYSLRGFGNAHGAPQLQPGPYDPDTGPKFEIPAGVSDGLETMKFVVPAASPDLAVFTAFPHMHYVGIGQSVWVHRARPAPGEPTTECLVNVNRWNFDWQRQYAVDAPTAELPRVRAGDTVELRCRYDNTLANPFVQRALAEQNLSGPVTVNLGEQTLDEMCIALFAVIADR